eukprot:scaffold233478_cov17-Tisochrysis_lutea.AAC.1
MLQVPTPVAQSYGRQQAIGHGREGKQALPGFVVAFLWLLEFGYRPITPPFSVRLNKLNGRRYFVELSGRRRVKIQDCHDLDGYRMASAEVIEHDDYPAEGSPETERSIAYHIKHEKLPTGVHSPTHSLPPVISSLSDLMLPDYLCCCFDGQGHGSAAWGDGIGGAADKAGGTLKCPARSNTRAHSTCRCAKQRAGCAELRATDRLSPMQLIR